MLLDEPLVNLDYKLREELREELTQLFAAGESTVVYATTEPTEALLLGGYTAVMDAGELLQYGLTAEVFRRPKSIRVARAFSDPPMNLLPASAASIGVTLDGRPQPLGAAAHPCRRRRRHADHRRARQRCACSQRPGDVALAGTVELAEISGSDTFVHAATPVGGWWRARTGVHQFGSAPGDALPRPGAGLRVRCERRLLVGRRERLAGADDMARIDLDLAHSYRPNPRKDGTTRCCP